MVSASLPDDGRLLKFAGSLYSHSGILKRHSVISDMKNVPGFSPFIPSGKEAGEGPPTSYRNSLYSDNAPEIAGKAVENAFSSVPSFEPESVTHLLTPDCTGFYSPGIDLSLVKMFGLRRDISRINIGFMGCMAAIPALAAAGPSAFQAPAPGSSCSAQSCVRSITGTGSMKIRCSRTAFSPTGREPPYCRRTGGTGRGMDSSCFLSRPG